MIQIISAALALCVGCDTQVRPTPEVCTVIDAGTALPDEVRETSGVAISSFDPTVLWTHNDRNNSPHVFAVNAAGELVARVRVTGAALVDWEDIERAPCAAGTCLYIADIGDNDGDRESITIYEVPEPRPGDEATHPAHALTVRYPDGPRDAEALFVAPNGDIYIIAKGRTEPVDLYRLPAADRDGAAILEEVRELAPQPSSRRDWVTGATLSEDGAWIALRTYRTLFFFPTEAFISGPTPDPIRFDLTPLGERQGEGVAMDADGTVWLTSEAEGRGQVPMRARLHCTP
jgi:hypothetical protein